MSYDVIIAGAGFSGSSAARILAERGKKVLLIEKRDHVGGNCYDLKNAFGITIQKYGPHIFHTQSEAVWEFLNRFSDFNDYKHKVLSKVGEKFYPIPINKTTVCDFLNLDINTVNIAEILKQEVEKSTFSMPPRNFQDQVISQVGERLYEAFFKGYTMKQWGKEPENLAADIAKRVPVRDNLDDYYFSDKYQGIPTNGFTLLFEKMLDHPNITVLLNTDYFEVRSRYKSELTVYTGELDRFFDYKYGHLEYRSLEFKYENLEQKQFQPVAVVNYPGDEPWTRITEYKQFLRENVDWTTLCYEYPASKGEPYYVIINDENLKKRELYMQEAQKLEADGSVLFIGRLAEYKYYNIDQVVESVIIKVKNVRQNV
ncbi:MAG: UDP-galactopyranose mutase [Candidatus Melainabacteria bacterium GWF2_37_15]|nr:MAG: UDP-galactopyranose mutase [Candidatus Melainabacteria bacterium GWF2_37_15]